MKLIVITAEHFFKEEALWINELMAQAYGREPAQGFQGYGLTGAQEETHLQGGCTMLLHLRKPNSRKEEMEQLIEEIDNRFYSRLVLHDHLHLANKYKLGGVHLNSRNEQQYNGMVTCRALKGAQTIHALPTTPANADEESRYWKNCRVSRSCHSLEEVARYKEWCSYVTLSPVFNSISKQGYNAAFSQEELVRAKDLNIIDEKVVALGGIGPENIAQIKELGFGGAAVLGAIWKSRTLDEARMNLELLVKNSK